MVIGLTGNTLLLMMLIRKQQWESSLSVYLLSLAVADSGAIITTFLDDLGHRTYYNERFYGVVAICKISTYMFFMLTTSSSWFMTTVTMERAVVIMRGKLPGKSKLRRFALVAVVTVWVTIAAIYAIIPVMYTQVIYPSSSDESGQSYNASDGLLATMATKHITTTYPITSVNTSGNEPVDLNKGDFISTMPRENNINMTNQIKNNNEIIEFDMLCEHQKKYYDFYDTYFTWLDLAVYSFIPSCIICISNFLVILTLFRHSQNEQLQDTQSVGQKNSKITLMLLFVSFYFLVATLPSVIYPFIGVRYFDDYFSFSPDNVWYVVTNTLVLSNHCVNFYVFIIFNDSYRRDFMLMVKSGFCKEA